MTSAPSSIVMLRAGGRRPRDVRVVGVVVLAVDRIDVGMPYRSTSAAATSSCVESGLEAQRSDVGAARRERAREVGRLGRHVQAAESGIRRAASRARSARGSPAAQACAGRPIDPPHSLGRRARCRGRHASERSSPWPNSISASPRRGRSGPRAGRRLRPPASRLPGGTVSSRARMRCTVPARKVEGTARAPRPRARVRAARAPISNSARP